MFSILIELNDYLQLERIAPSLLLEIRRMIVRGMEAGKCRMQKESGGAFLFRAESEYSAEPTSALRTTLRVYELLKQHREQLYGFSVCFDLAHNEEPGSLFRSMHAWALSFPDDESFWIGERMAPLVNVLEMERRNGFSRVTGMRRRAERGFTGLPGFARMLPVRQELHDALEAHLYGRSPCGSLLLTGPSGHGLIHHVSIALENILGQSDGWMVVPENRGYRSPQVPLLHAMNRKQMDETPLFLVRSERVIWKRLLPLLEISSAERRTWPAPDRLEQDLGFLFLLYLTAFRRRMEEMLLPPVIVLHRPHGYGRQFRTLLSRAIADVSGNGRIVPVIVEEKPRTPDPRFFPVDRHVRIGYPKSDTIREILDGTERQTGIDIPGLCGLTGRKTVPLFLVFTLLQEGPEAAEKVREMIRQGTDRNDEPLYPVLFGRLSEREQDLLCVASAAAGLFRPDEALQLADPRLDTTDIHELLGRLSQLGFISTENGAAAFTEGAFLLADRFLGGRFRQACREVGFLLEALRERNLFREDRGLLALMTESGGLERSFSVARTFLRDTLNAGRTEEAARFCRSVHMHQDSAPVGQDERRRLRRANLFRISLIRADDRSARLHAHDAVTATEGGGVDRGADMQLCFGKYLRKQGAVRDALESVKRALIGFQESDDTAGECQASIELGILTLHEERIPDAADYFAICRKMAESEGMLFELTVAAGLEAAALFVYGDYTGSLRICREARKDAERAALHEWELYALFLEGRIFFDLGRYAAARALFLGGRAVARAYGFPEGERVLRDWVGRTFLYEGKVRTAIDMLRTGPESPEAQLFLAEALIEEKRFDEAGAALRRGFALGERQEAERQFPPGEFLNWSSGFASVEELAVGSGRKGSLLLHMMKVYRGYLLGKTDDPEKMSAGRAELHRLTRTDRLSPLDPNNCLYCYLFMLALPETKESDTDDRSTVLGMAVKYLQERASRIEAYADRLTYIRNNLWNRRIVAESKRFNLV